MARFRHGAGRLSLDFIRTLRYRGSPRAVEELPDEEALGAWLRQFGPCDPGTPSPAQVVTAQQLREAIHALLTGCAASRDVVNAAAAAPPPVPAIEESGALHWRASVPALLSLLARDAMDLIASPAFDRVRGCANPDCGVLFLDTSRPGTRRWCSMDTCGNVAKKATLRRRAS
jgi:predicted RNA-binding Zn ribbon-like protein